jgi:hypothetical protein
MMDANLPPVPRTSVDKPSACVTIRLYLAVLDDLSPLQKQFVCEHINSCAACTTELSILRRVEPLATGPDQFAPPPRVDQVVMAAIATRGMACHQAPTCSFMRRQRSAWFMLCAAVLTLVVVMMAAFQWPGALFTPSRAFALPTDLSWSGYVLYHTETMPGTHGVQYHISCYHDLGTGNMRVETTAGNDLDIVAIGNEQVLLGEDLIYHVAQWGAHTWGVDDSLFNLGHLRADMQAHRAVYLGQDTFQGQEVYRLRWHGLVLLLNERYLPVNVLSNARGPGTGQPLYQMLTMLPVAQVPAAFWEALVPAGFRIGVLPARS